MWRFSEMKRFGINLVVTGLVLASCPGFNATSHAGEKKVIVRGVGPAYEQVGKLAVMHAGRVKPLDTVAREEVKQVYSREKIKLHDGSNEVVETWASVAAFLDWTVRPEYWDDQPFILVDYLPLRRLILQGAIRSNLKELAARDSTPADDRAQLTTLVELSEISSEALSDYLKTSKLPKDDLVAVKELAGKLGEEHKWLTPREIESAQIDHKGHLHEFMDWAQELQEQKRKFDANPKSTDRLTEIERRAIDVGHRLLTYSAYSGDRVNPAGLVRVMPRPSRPKALAYVGKVLKKARETRDQNAHSPIELDTLNALVTYWNDVPRDDRHDPGENAQFDEKFATWLNESSVWLPLKVILKTSPEELVEAGYPEAEVRAFLTAYRELEHAESLKPGEVSEASASAMLASSRSLGQAVSRAKYPTAAMIERETHFNSANPFWQAPIAYGAALGLLAISLGFVAGRHTVVGRAGHALYLMGMIALAAGIALEIYGFSLRIRISGWAPVTNMYETVIWVALVAAVLSLVFELIYRKTFSALAGSAVALLGTITAVNVPLLDPSIRSLQPVLRSNFWLTIHVLTIVSSYAAFGLAWMLGLIAMGYYLTAVYKRSPSLMELAWLLLPGVGLVAAGSLGALAFAGGTSGRWGVSDVMYFGFVFVAAIGGILALASVIAVAGEVLN